MLFDCFQEVHKNSTKRTLQRNSIWSDALGSSSILRCSLSKTSMNLMAEYQNVGYFRLAWRNWRQDTQQPSLLKLSPQTAFPTTQIGMFLQYWCTTTVLSKGLTSVCSSSVEGDAHLNVSFTTINFQYPICPELVQVARNFLSVHCTPVNGIWLF